MFDFNYWLTIKIVKAILYLGPTLNIPSVCLLNLHLVSDAWSTWTSMRLRTSRLHELCHSTQQTVTTKPNLWSPADHRRIFPTSITVDPCCLVRLSSYAQRDKSLPSLVHRELIKQAISFMIALNGPEQNGGRREEECGVWQMDSWWRGGREERRWWCRRLSLFFFFFFLR